MRGKYASLTEWLVARPRETFEVTIGEIERILGAPLPASYRRHVPIWYGNRPSTVVGAIKAAGWRARSFDLTAERLPLEPASTAVDAPDAGSPVRRPSRRDESLDGGVWEGEVQSRVVAYLLANGWTILAVADTGARQRGDDIRARKGTQELVVEVKGYPSRSYADPRRAEEAKPSHPSAQARHYVADALVTILKVLGTQPDAMAAIAFPDVARYRSLLSDLRHPLERLGIAVLLVGDEGAVEEMLPLRQ